MDDIIKEMDQLYEQNKVREAYEFLLPHKDTEDFAVQWKFARLCYRMGRMDGSHQPKQFGIEALEHINRAIALNQDSFDVHMVSVEQLKSVNSMYVFMQLRLLWKKSICNLEIFQLCSYVLMKIWFHAIVVTIMNAKQVNAHNIIDIF